MPWYKGWKVNLRDRGEVTGVTLLDALNAIQLPKRAVEMPLRIPILNVYKIGGVGTVAIGRVACGVLKKGDTVSIMPNNLQGTTNSIEIYHSNRGEVMAGKNSQFFLNFSPQIIFSSNKFTSMFPHQKLFFPPTNSL
jgi:elongation factor 1-alpha